MIYKRIFFDENVQSQKDLEMLAKIIISECVSRSIPILKERVKEMKEMFLRHNEEVTLDSFKSNIYPIYFPVRMKSLEHTKVTRDLKKFLKTISDFRVEFFPRHRRSTTAGTYRGKEIIIYIATNDYEEAENLVTDTYIYNPDNFRLESESRNLQKILEKSKSTIVHELQHYYDDFRSSGGYKSANYTSDSESDIYWKSPEEVSARYTQTVFNLKKSSKIYKDWKTVLYTFKDEFRKWELLDRETQKRLISRLSQEYAEVHKQTKKPLLNIEKEVNILAKKFDDKEIEIYYNSIGTKYIEIRKLNTGNIRKDEEALKQIVRLADRYRHPTICYVEKGWVTGIKQSIDLLKSYGFKPNSGRYTDYKFKSSKRNFIRKSKRK